MQKNFHFGMLIPRYKNWGGLSWSGGGWDLRKTVAARDPLWKERAVDSMDASFRRHDIGYRSGDKWGADINLMSELWQMDTSNLSAYGHAYRTGAIGLFSITAGKQLYKETIKPSSIWVTVQTLP